MEEDGEQEKKIPSWYYNWAILPLDLSISGKLITINYFTDVSCQLQDLLH